MCHIMINMSCVCLPLSFEFLRKCEKCVILLVNDHLVCEYLFNLEFFIKRFQLFNFDYIIIVPYKTFVYLSIVLPYWRIFYVPAEHIKYLLPRFVMRKNGNAIVCFSTDIVYGSFELKVKNFCKLSTLSVAKSQRPILF